MYNIAIIAQFTYVPCEVKKITIWLSSSSSNYSSFFSRPSAILSCLLMLVYIINPLHFLARSAVCPQMSCTSCLSNNDIQTPDQVSVPCTTIPYFHKDTLTPPSSSRSPALGGGPSTYVARDASLYNARPLLRDLHHAP